MMLALLLLLATPAERFEQIKREATPQELYALLYAMPKGGDIHHHFSLAHRPQDLWHAATAPEILRGNAFYTRFRDGGCAESTQPLLRFLNLQRSSYAKLNACEKSDFVPLTSLTPAQKAEWLSSLILDRPGEGRDEFFERIVPRVKDLVRDPNVTTYLLGENLKRYGRENILYIEANSGEPRFVRQDGSPYPTEEAAGFLRQRLAQPDLTPDAATLRLQLTAIRFAPDAEAQVARAYEFVAAHRDLWVGVNIAGREDNDKGHPARLLNAFREARRKHAGIPLSLHGGEKDSTGDDVRQTLLLGADRIGHGLNLISDPDTLLLMRNSRYLVEINLISNRVLEYFPDLDWHPFPEYLRLGVPVCLNTDDPGVWDSNLTDEYFTAIRHFNVTWDEIVAMGRNSLLYSFAEAPLKEKLLAEYARRVADFESRVLLGDWRAAARQTASEVSGYARRNFGVTSSARESRRPDSSTPRPR